MTKAINKEIKAAKTSDPERSERLRQQLGKMYRSYISTVHSFCNRVIKEFFYLTDSSRTSRYVIASRLNHEDGSYRRGV